MIDILTSDLFQALNTNNQKLLGFLIDDQCLFNDSDNHSIIGKKGVISKLIDTYQNSELSIVSGIKNDDQTLLLAYQYKQKDQTQLGSLIVRQNENKKINFIKTVALDPALLSS